MSFDLENNFNRSRVNRKKRVIQMNHVRYPEDQVFEALLKPQGWKEQRWVLHHLAQSSSYLSHLFSILKAHIKRNELQNPTNYPKNVQFLSKTKTFLSKPLCNSFDYLKILFEELNQLEKFTYDKISEDFDPFKSHKNERIRFNSISKDDTKESSNALIFDSIKYIFHIFTIFKAIYIEFIKNLTLSEHKNGQLSIKNPFEEEKKSNENEKYFFENFRKFYFIILMFHLPLSVSLSPTKKVAKLNTKQYRKKVTRRSPKRHNLKVLERLGFELYVNKRLIYEKEILKWEEQLSEWKWRKEASQGNIKSFKEELDGIKDSEEGKVNRVKLMIVGQGRAGKSATLRSLLGKAFHKESKSTVGVSLSHTKPIMVSKFNDWKTTDEVNFTSNVAFNLALASMTKKVVPTVSKDQIYRTASRGSLKYSSRTFSKISDISTSTISEAEVNPFPQSPSPSRSRRKSRKQQKIYKSGGSRGSSHTPKTLRLKKKKFNSLSRLVDAMKPGAVHDTGLQISRTREREKDRGREPLKTSLKRQKQKTKSRTPSPHSSTAKSSIDEKSEDSFSRTKTHLHRNQTRKRVAKISQRQLKRSFDPEILLPKRRQSRSKSHSSSIFRSTSLGEKSWQSQRFIGFTIWDFAGQKVFHNLHHLFLNSSGIFLLVFDLRKFVLQSQRERERDRERERVLFEKLKEHLIFWLGSINLHSEKGKILLIGTFAEEIKSQDMKEINKQLIKILFNFTQLSLSPSPFLSDSETPISKQNIVLKKLNIVENEKEKLIFFPIDNKSTKGIRPLRKILIKRALKVENSLSKIPIRWTKLIDSLLQKSKKNRIYCFSLKSVKEQAHGFEISASKIVEILIYFHNLGHILYFPHNESMKNIVITSPEWLISKLTLLIRDLKKQPLSTRIRQGIESNDLKDDYKLLIKKGLCTDDLLDVLWTDKANRNFFINLLKCNLLISVYCFKPKNFSFAENDEDLKAEKQKNKMFQLEDEEEDSKKGHPKIKMFLVPSLLSQNSSSKKKDDKEPKLVPIFNMFKNRLKTLQNQEKESNSSKLNRSLLRVTKRISELSMSHRSRRSSRKTTRSSGFLKNFEFHDHHFVVYFSFLANGVFERIICSCLHHSIRKSYDESLERVADHLEPVIEEDRAKFSFGENCTVTMTKLNYNEIYVAVEDGQFCPIFVSMIEATLKKIRNEVFNINFNWTIYVYLNNLQNHDSFMTHGQALKEKIEPWFQKRSGSYFPQKGEDEVQPFDIDIEGFLGLGS